ncbi:MAG: hypothetical protein NTW10_03880 [Bacteroidetes bacterium]|nr:hypothetical protein [Bacteroidota bacterium]
MTAEEVKKEHIKVLGVELGTQYNLLYNEIITLQTLYNEFSFLYMGTGKRMKVMNQAAPFFFFILQKVFWEYILLGISRVTDPPKSFAKANITIRSFPELIEDPSLKTDICLKIDNIITDSEFCRYWRNKWISHIDYTYQLSKEDKSGMEATPQKVKKLLRDIQDLMNLVQIHYFHSSVAFEIPINIKGSNSLLYFLEQGLLNVNL